jgi:Uma2 family endonuclease
MSETPLMMPPAGWQIDDLDRLPESDHRYELTDGALTVSPSPSGLHQVISGLLVAALGRLASKQSPTRRVRAVPFDLPFAELLPR